MCTAIAAAVLSMVIGLIVGICSGYFGGKFDTACTPNASMHTASACNNGDENGRVYIDGSSVEFFRIRRSAPDSNMGFHDQCKQGLYLVCSVDGFLSRDYDCAYGFLFQYTWGCFKR